VAAKTGTSQSYRDNWTLGFTRDVTVGVWVGNFDRTELHHSSGAIGAAPLFHDVLLAAQRHVAGALPADARDAPSPRPDGLRSVSVCALSGQIASHACPVRHPEYLPTGVEHAECDWHVADEGRVRWPSRYRAWATEHQRAQAHPEPPPLVLAASQPAFPEEPEPALASAPRPLRHAGSSGGLSIVSPPDGAAYLLDPTLRSQFQTLPLRATGEPGPIEWHVDGARIGSSPTGAALRWPLAPGAHVVAARDVRGRTAEVRIRVR
jgi:penicillin-binding protein 1C